MPGTRSKPAASLVCPKGSHDRALHKLLKARLYLYQVEGMLFAARAGRALLGDEMGLGKTVQAIAAAELMARHADLITVWAPELVIADEARRIKNWNTVAARALKRIASPYALVLTGTPLSRWHGPQARRKPASAHRTGEHFQP